jgi:hypothetical protein
MKLSSSSVFLILLGVFVAFCLFSQIKSRYIENMVEAEADETTSDDTMLEQDTVNGIIASQGTDTTDVVEDDGDVQETPDFTERIGMKDPRKKGPEPFFMRGKRNNVEPFENVKQPSPNLQCPTPISSSAKNKVNTYIPPYKNKESSTMTKNLMNSVGNMITNFASQGYVPCNYGTCPDNKTCKTDSKGSNCSVYPTPLPKTCVGTMYGCCPDGVTTKNADGSICFAQQSSDEKKETPVQQTDMKKGVAAPENKFTTNTVLIPPPVGNVVNNACPEPPPCPACARCPEPSFECKKVPSYKNQSTFKKIIPQAILSDFSTFGM